MTASTKTTQGDAAVVGKKWYVKLSNLEKCFPHRIMGSDGLCPLNSVLDCQSRVAVFFLCEVGGDTELLSS